MRCILTICPSTSQTTHPSHLPSPYPSHPSHTSFFFTVALPLIQFAIQICLLAPHHTQMASSLSTFTSHYQPIHSSTTSISFCLISFQTNQGSMRWRWDGMEIFSTYLYALEKRFSHFIKLYIKSLPSWVLLGKNLTPTIQTTADCLYTRVDVSICVCLCVCVLCVCAFILCTA